MNIKRLASLFVLMAMNAAPGHAATLRTVTELHTDIVYLSDLFDGVLHDRGIGPSPNVGERLFIEAPQLDAIARQFDVDWHSAGPADRVLLSRSGAPFTREETMAILRPALAGVGVSDDANVDLEGFTPPMLSPGETVTGNVQGLDYDPVSGRFTAILTLAAPRQPSLQTRLVGRVQEMLSLPVASHRLLPGDVVLESDLKIGHLAASIVRNEVARSTAQLIGMEIRRPIAPGTPFGTADFGRPAAVKKGQIVHIQLEHPGLLISAQGVAADSGAVGDRVRVTNVSSRATLDTQVVGVGQVRLTAPAATYDLAYNSLPVSEVKP